MTPPVGPRRRMLFGSGLLCALVYTGLAVVFTYPLCFHLTEAVPRGNGSGDSLTFMWNLWWVKHAVVDLGVTPLRTSLIGLGGERSLFFHTL